MQAVARCVVIYNARASRSAIARDVGCRMEWACQRYATWLTPHSVDRP